LPAWADRDLTSISKHDVLSVLDSLTKRGAVPQARRLFATLQTFFKWCLKRDLLSVSPMASIEKKDLGRENSRERVLSDAELGKLLALVRGANEYDPYLVATHLMILTGARGLRWDEINGDTIELPASRMKNGLPFDLPITPLMASILETIPRFEGSPYVCTTNGKSSLRHWDRAKKSIDAKSGVTGWQHRDLRRTMQTGLQRLGLPEGLGLFGWA